MFALTDKISDNVTTRLNPALASARQLVDTRVIPFAVPAGRKAAQQVRVVVAGRIVPAVSAASVNARVASAPVRAEAVRRSKLAAAALSGEAAVSKKHRRWPVALAFLVFGAGLGAAAAWLAQAGRPVQLTPYPLTDDDGDRVPVDLTEEFSAHHTA
jgi:hypothetical protein